MEFENTHFFILLFHTSLSYLSFIPLFLSSFIPLFRTSLSLTHTTYLCSNTGTESVRILVSLTQLKKATIPTHNNATRIFLTMRLEYWRCEPRASRSNTAKRENFGSDPRRNQESNNRKQVRDSIGCSRILNNTNPHCEMCDTE